MIGRPLLAVLAAMLVAGAFASLRPPHALAADDDATIERGRYLVLQVGMCVDCHGSSLHGSKLDFLAAELPAAHTAPRIAGLPRMSVAQGVTYFTTGKLPNGKPSRPPMPQYRLHRDDALAVVTFLKSLP